MSFAFSPRSDLLHHRDTEGTEELLCVLGASVVNTPRFLGHITSCFGLFENLVVNQRNVGSKFAEVFRIDLLELEHGQMKDFWQLLQIFPHFFNALPSRVLLSLVLAAL